MSGTSGRTVFVRIHADMCNDTILPPTKSALHRTFHDPRYCPPSNTYPLRDRRNTCLLHPANHLRLKPKRIPGTWRIPRNQHRQNSMRWTSDPRHTIPYDTFPCLKSPRTRTPNIIKYTDLRTLRMYQYESPI